jgi:hypothetical protein
MTPVGRLTAMVLGEYTAPGDHQRVAILDDRKLVKAVWETRLRPSRLGPIASKILECARSADQAAVLFWRNQRHRINARRFEGVMGVG